MEFERLGIEPDWNRVNYYILLDSYFDVSRETSLNEKKNVVYYEHLGLK